MITFTYNPETRSFAMTQDQVISVIDALKKKYPEITFYPVKDYDNACYISAKSTELIRDLANQSNENAEELAKVFGLTVEQVKTISGHVVLYGKDFSAPEIIAHELGHYEVETRGRLSKICQKYLHPKKFISKLAGLGLGLAVLADPKKAWIPGLVSILNKLPQIYYEARASKKGIKMLKEVQGNNFDKDDLESMKSSLKGAWGTYVFGALALPVAATTITAIGSAGLAKPDEAIAIAAGGIGSNLAVAALQRRSAKKMMKHAGKRKIQILGIKGGTLIDRFKGKIRSIKEGVKLNRVQGIINNVKSSGFERRYSIATPVREDARNSKQYRVISNLRGGTDNHNKVSVNTVTAKSPFEAQKKVIDKNKSRHGASKHGAVKAFEAGRQDMAATHYMQSMSERVQKAKML